MSVSDLWRGMVSCKSHVSELKNWMPRHSKKQSVGVELRADGDTYRSEKPGGSASGMRQKMHSHPVSSTGVLLTVFLTCSKSAK